MMIVDVGLPYPAGTPLENSRIVAALRLRFSIQPTTVHNR